MSAKNLNEDCKNDEEDGKIEKRENEERDDDSISTAQMDNVTKTKVKENNKG